MKKGIFTILCAVSAFCFANVKIVDLNSLGEPNTFQNNLIIEIDNIKKVALNENNKSSTQVIYLIDQYDYNRNDLLFKTDVQDVFIGNCLNPTETMKIRVVNNKSIIFKRDKCYGDGFVTFKAAYEKDRLYLLEEFAKEEKIYVDLKLDNERVRTYFEPKGFKDYSEFVIKTQKALQGNL
jgi:hypothetical protein